MEQQKKQRGGHLPGAGRSAHGWITDMEDIARRVTDNK